MAGTHHSCRHSIADLILNLKAMISTTSLSVVSYLYGRPGILSRAPSDFPQMLPGTVDRPTFPLNLLADFAGGGLMCALGILLALFSRSSSGKGQLVHTDMVSGARYLSSFPLLHALIPNSPLFGLDNTRGTKVLDGGAPYYDVYTCSDGKWMSVGCIEPQFFAAFISNFVKALPGDFVDTLEGWRPTLDMRNEVDKWPQLRDFLERGFRTRTRDEWTKVFHGMPTALLSNMTFLLTEGNSGTDSCAVPVLSPAEAAATTSALPAPHPVLTRTPAYALPTSWRSSEASTNLKPGQHTDVILTELGLNEDEKLKLASTGVLGSSPKARL